MASLYRFGKPIRAYSQKLSTSEGQACLRPLFVHVGFVGTKTSNVSRLGRCDVEINWSKIALLYRREVKCRI